MPPRVRGEDLRIGPIVFRGLASPRKAWWFEPGEVIARHLRRGDDPDLHRSDARDFADEAIANGRDLYAAQSVLVDVPASTAVTIAVPEADTNVAIAPGGVTRVGGFVPGDGAKRVRCEADEPSAFHLGFIVAGARCVPVTVTVGGREFTKLVRFGVRSCW